jgi:hypothetical protein
MTSQTFSVARVTVAALCALLAASAAPAQGTSVPQPSAADRALAIRVLRETPLIDGHNDLPWRIREDTVRPADVPAYDLTKHMAGMTDLDRLKKGMLGAQFWSVYIPGEASAPLYLPNGKVSSEPGSTSRAARSPRIQTGSSGRPPRLTSGARSRTARSGRCSAWKAATRSRTRWARCARTTISASAT